MRRAVEGQVLDDVGQAALVLVLEDRAGVDDQAQLGPVLRLPVLADPVAEAVRELADRDPGVDRDLLVEGVGGGRSGRGRLVLGPDGGRRDERNDRQGGGQEEGQG